MNPKIAIGINTYKNADKYTLEEKLCIESLIKVKSQYPDIIHLYNITFEDENYTIEQFNNLHVLKESAKEIIYNYFDHPGLTKEFEYIKANKDKIRKIPSVFDIFTVLSEQPCDYFIFLNNDNIISNRFIKEILNNPEIECFPASKLHTFGIKSLDDTTFIPESISVHGFDGFGIKSQWWKDNKYNFSRYILGSPYWDTHYFTICQLMAKTKTLNKLPPVLFHNDHKSTSMENSIEGYYNKDIFNRDLICSNLWFTYVNNILLKRKTVNNIKWYLPFNNEEQLEKIYFKARISQIEYVHTNKYIDFPILTQDKKIDVMIPCAPKDYNKISYTINSIIEHVKGLNEIHIITPKPVEKLNINYPIKYHLDLDVLPIDPLQFKFRPNWIFQQLLKLFQNITSTEYYLTFDVDGILIKDMEFFEDNHPIWYIGWRQNHLPYFLFNQYIINLNKVCNHTFIGDMCFFNKKIIKYMLDKNGLTVNDFVERTAKLSTMAIHIGEPELYGNFVFKYYPDLYKIKKIKQYHNGKYQNNPDEETWTDKEIKNLLEEGKKTDNHIVQLHSWCANTKDYWKN